MNRLLFRKAHLAIAGAKMGNESSTGYWIWFERVQIGKPCMFMDRYGTQVWILKTRENTGITQDYSRVSMMAGQSVFVTEYSYIDRDTPIAAIRRAEVNKLIKPYRHMGLNSWGDLVNK